ncbi:MAG: hypothetical protein HC839_04940 [Leptolyngbyaceae cyanobacterium RM2_2_21]|nr:hypothetical protein [Leptolyngbyaceae cyanobacterium RM2_2_21]
MAHLLAIAVGLGSFAFYMVAFFYPEVHRKSDFIWSGVGLFYGLVLWFCAGRITGALMLGQMSSTALVLVLGWQTLSLRRSRTPVALQTPVSSGDLRRQAQQVWQQLQKGFGAGSGIDSLVKTARSVFNRLQETLQKGITAATQPASNSQRITKPRPADYEYTEVEPRSPTPAAANPFLHSAKSPPPPRCCGPGYSSGFYGLTAQISYPTSAPSQQTHHPQNLAQQDPPAPAPDQTAHDRAAATTAFDRAIAQTCRLKTYPLCPNGKVSARRHHRC